MSQVPLEAKTRRHVADVLYDAASRVASAHAVESTLEELPALSLYAFVTSLMTLGSRILKMGKLELGVAQVMSWQRPALTLSVLVGYTTLCYHPQWLVILPLFYFTFFVLFPNYAHRFKIDEDACAVEFDPLLMVAASSDDEKRKNSRTLLQAVKQGQKSLTSIVAALDKLDEFRYGPARFADAQVSSMMLLSTCAVLFSSAWLLTFVSVPAFFAMVGWAVVGSKHPLAKLTSEKLEDIHIKSSLDVKELYAKFVDYCHKTVLLDEKPLRRVVEIYELQSQGLTARQWDSLSSVYSTSPYAVGSPSRLNKERPQGASDFGEVIPPDGWYFDLNDNWERDQSALNWTSMNGISHVKVSGPWAYDTQSEGTLWRRCRWTRYCYYDLK